MTQATRDLISRYYSEVWEKGNTDACDELLADDYIDRNPPPGMGSDKASAKVLAAMVTGSMKDTAMDVIHVVVEGDLAAAHWTMQWTQVGDFMGMIPADGKRIDLHGHDFYRVKDGRIAEIWHCEDFLGVMGQLGVLPAM